MTRRAHRWIAVAVVAFAVASPGCKSSDSNKGTPGPAADATSAVGDSKASAPDATVANPACKASGSKVVKLTTDDKIELEADLSLSGATNGPAAVLLHMIPPSNTRRNYPAAFIAKLVAAGFTVLNVDRRGAGNSKGRARDAYTGPLGKFDALAATTFLSKHACPPDPARVVIIGASNGTTTALDFAIHAGGSKTVAAPAGLVFLTGGSYTEAQNRIAAQTTTLNSMPVQFVFSTAERAWSARFVAGASGKWEFKEYAAGAHGTAMFGAVPASMDDVVGFVRRAAIAR